MALPDQEQHVMHERGRASRGVDAVVPDNLRRLRARRRWRQQDLAAAAGWARATVVAVEGGQRRLTLRDAAALCRALDVPLGELLYGSDDADVLGLETGELRPAQ
jgi:transcriptional regulator with XRE-family HTH domain